MQREPLFGSQLEQHWQKAKLKSCTETVREISVLVVFDDIKRILFDLLGVMMLPFYGLKMFLLEFSTKTSVDKMI